jgi:hypothetical protein
VDPALRFYGLLVDLALPFLVLLVDFALPFLVLALRRKRCKLLIEQAFLLGVSAIWGCAKDL